MLVYPVLCALLGTIVFVAISGAEQYAFADFAVRYLGSLLVISCVVAWRRFRGNAPTDLGGSASKALDQQSAPSRSIVRRTFGKPAWLRHEGVWRLLQTLRLGLPMVFAVIVLVATAEQRQPDWEGYFLLVALGVPIIFVVVHFSFWLVRWIIGGFFSEKRKA